jgi:hypothetical protein
MDLEIPHPKYVFSQRSKSAVSFQTSHRELEMDLGHEANFRVDQKRNDFFVSSKFLFEFSVLVSYTRVTRWTIFP